jgi:hypothetical protein
MMPDIPKYINIKTQSILKLLEKISYEVTGVTNSAINTANNFLLQSTLWTDYWMVIGNLKQQVY